jgi:signal transduction histidine kinase
MLVPDEYLFMRCEDRSIQVWVSQSLSGARIGSMIDVVGYPLLVDSNVLLQDGIFKVIAHGQAPQPLDLTYSEILHRFVDVELVRMRGLLLQDTIREASRLLILEMDGHLVEASFSGQMGRAGLAGSQPFRPGTELELTGISRVKGTTDWDGSIKALDMSLNLRDLSDVRVVKAAPWWTKGRVLVFLAVLMALATAVSGWAVTLRRRVSAQTLLIREQAEREASERERIRIARNIHDDLGSRLTQLALLGERVKYAVGESGPAAELGVRISGTALSAVATMDEIVWAVNPRNDSLQSLADYLCQLTPSELSDAGIRCELDVPAVLPALSLGAEIRHGLVLAVREILHNIIKHSGASEIRLGLQLEDHGILEISISDNGRGFDPATVSARRNGLLNLRGRMADAGGACEIESSHGSGTRVVLRVPLDGKKDSLRDHTKV